ncbi:unnamed protein product [Trichogramma brassicae]|uniref:Large ribosomal subunit protein mL53 n=1 Tax=Trichogramma brassicae TaxID=86971 RepID=A0A6H5IS37_9HYME|nr:unnamed protein product [Trichogramma brassicae]
MSILFNGTRTRSAGLISALAKQIKLVNLQPLSKITVRFDPFHEQALETRSFLFHISGRRVAATNYDCSIKTEIACDRSDPTIVCNYQGSDEKLVFKSKNLTALELLREFNKNVSSRVEVPTEEPTLSGKAKQGKKKKF